MLAWINGTRLTGYWGSDTPWWKVGPGGRVVEMATAPKPDFFDSLEPGAAAAAVVATVVSASSLRKATEDTSTSPEKRGL